MSPAAVPWHEPAAAPGAGPRARPRAAGAATAYRGLPRSIRIAAWIVLDMVVGAVTGATLPGAMRGLGATAALAPGRLAWDAARVSGFLAYAAVAGSVIYGLLLSTRLLDAIAHRPVSFALHKDLALVGLALSALHGLLLLGDRTYPFTVAAISVPFLAPYAPVAVGIGQLAFYLVAVVTGSFYVRRRIGQRTWRLVHYLTFAAFIGTTLHGVASGSDSAAWWAAWLYLVPTAAVVFFTVYRLVTGIAGRRDRALPLPVRAVRPGILEEV